MWLQNSGPLEAQSVLLTSEPSLQPQFLTPFPLSSTAAHCQIHHTPLIQSNNNGFHLHHQGLSPIKNYGVAEAVRSPSSSPAQSTQRSPVSKEFRRHCGRGAWEQSALETAGVGECASFEGFQDGSSDLWETLVHTDLDEVFGSCWGLQNTELGLQ